MRKIIIGGLVVVIAFVGTLWALGTFSPSRTLTDHRPALAKLPDLQPFTRTSHVIAPVAIANSAIRDAMEAAAPRDLTGKRENPLTELLGKADIGWTIGRGPIAVTGTAAGLAISTPINGTLRATGQIANQAGSVAGAVTRLLGDSVGREVQSLATRTLDQRAEIRGSVTVTARPSLQPTWRMDPNLSGQVALAQTGMNIAGIRLNVANEVKPLLDRTVNDQIVRLSGRLRNDPTLEQVARREWAKMCRSIPLGAALPGTPNLWLEVRPIRAAAANPRIEAASTVLTVGVQAETRIVSGETRPNCPFPAQLDIVPQLDQGKLAIALPIDLPFTELNRLLEAQLKGKTFGGEAGAAAEVTVLAAKLAASGERLLISLRVKAREKKSWLGLGAEATVHIWGRPVLDHRQQLLRLTDIALDVESEAAFGLLGAAARTAIPYLQATLAENAVIDLKPFAASAKQSIAAAIADFQKQTDAVRAEAAVTELRLTGIAFDSKTLRVIAEADGTVRIAVTKLAVQ
jgi:hypothetical protein